MLPGLNGLEVLRRLRGAGVKTPVILLTARDSVMDKVAGLDTGANDYVTKPFHIEELARIRVLTRGAADDGLLRNADVTPDRKKRQVTRAGEEIALTKTQFDLLEYFMLNPDIVLTREQLLSAVWGYSYAGDSNVVDVYVRYVRRRLHDPAEGGLIESVRGAAMSCARRRRSERGLSERLTRAYALFFAAMTLCLSLCVYAVSRHMLIDRRADELAASADALAEGHDSADPNVLWELCTDDTLTLILLDEDGEAVGRAGYFEIDASILPRTVQKTPLLHILSGEKAALVCARAVTGGLLCVVRRVDGEYAFLHSLLLLLIVLNAAAALISLVAGRAVARRMLRPLSQMIARARAIDAGALDVRLSVPENGGELRDLAETLNDMLDRVQNAFVRQGQFTQDASHELRTPLSVLQGNAELLARWGKDDPAVRDKCVAAILRQSDYMRRLADSLLFLSRGDRGMQSVEKRALDVSALFGELIDERRLIDPDHVYTLDAPPDMAVSADETMLRQLLIILMDNAAKYTPAGGGVHLSAAREGKSAIIALSDEGCGVPDDQLDKIFERFYRVDKARSRETGGTGLGLAIAKVIVELHGGLRVVAELPME